MSAIGATLGVRGLGDREGKIQDGGTARQAGLR